MRTSVCKGCGADIMFMVFADVGSPAGYWILCSESPTVASASCHVWGFHAPLVPTRPVVVADLARVFWGL